MEGGTGICFCSWIFPAGCPFTCRYATRSCWGIASGELAPGEKLPTIRALAEQSGVNMMTVSKAYSLLKQEGYITADRRGGTVVSGSPGAGELSARYRGALRIIAAEARLAGVDEDGFLAPLPGHLSRRGTRKWVTSRSGSSSSPCSGRCCRS